MADAEAMGRLISLALRSGIPIMEVHRQLRGISSDRAVGLGPNKVLSVPDAIGIALERVVAGQAGGAAGAAADADAGEIRRSSRRLRSTRWSVPVSGQAGAQAEADEYQAYDGGERSWGRARTAGHSWSMRKGA